MKTQYLVTDPCYIVPKEDWSDFLDETGYGDYIPDEGYTIKGFGRIFEISGTDNGDGSIKIGKDKEVMVDAGIVCLVELDEGVTPTDYQGNAVTSARSTAYAWFNRACRI